MNFAKMHGLGNDFIILDSREGYIKDLQKVAVKVCDRHFGVGADGILVIEGSLKADIKMIIVNSDGSDAEMCGNGIRCFVKYLYENKIVNKDIINVETKAGIMTAELKIEGSSAKGIRIDMGKPVFEKELIPFAGEKNNLFYDLNLNGEIYPASTLLMGVPHTILFTDDINPKRVAELGKKVEIMDIFPNKTNVNFVKVIDSSTIEIRTWERGAGYTLACGTGTCASVVACSINRKTNNSVNAILAGGVLHVDYVDGRVFMEGPAEFICHGTLNI